MKTKNLFLVCLLGATLMMLSCQKDAGLTPEATVEQSMDLNESSNPGLELGFDDPEPYVDILSNYPDPFYTRTEIKFVISNTSEVSLSIVNMETGIGESLIKGTLEKGVYFKIFDVSKKPTGKYMATLIVNGRVYNEVMVKINNNAIFPIDTY